LVAYDKLVWRTPSIAQYSGSKNCPHVSHFWKDQQILKHVLSLTKGAWWWPKRVGSWLSESVCFV
jgi:hypothetical protein